MQEQERSLTHMLDLIRGLRCTCVVPLDCRTTAASAYSTTLHCVRVSYSSRLEAYDVPGDRCLRTPCRVQCSRRRCLQSRLLLRYSGFFDDFDDLLERLATCSAPLVIVGDFIIHVDDTTDTGAGRLHQSLTTYGLSQHIRSSTHRHGHPLDQAVNVLPSTSV